MADLSTAAPPPLAATRDRAVDLVRALCITGVVVLHAMMVGVTVDGSVPSFVNASDGTAWIVPLSWVLQVMPLFFVIGGFSGATAFRRRRSRGSGAAAFVAGRVQRLLVPAAVTIGTVGVLLAMLQSAGLPAALCSSPGSATASRCGSWVCSSCARRCFPHSCAAMSGHRHARSACSWSQRWRSTCYAPSRASKSSAS
jgi:peptidoglycan/LPS O-acetylase OafA/YrhL